MNWQKHRIQARLSFKSEVIEEIYATIAEIDGVKNSWHITDRLLPQTIENLTRSVIITSAGASNRIAGHHLTDIEVENLYRSLPVQEPKTRDMQEIAVYLQCLELIFSNYNKIPINEASILKLHKDMGLKGNYKIGTNRIEARIQVGSIVGVVFNSTPADLVQKEMQELIGWYSLAILNKTKHPLILIANFIFEYLAIHPFELGNGRTSRLLTNLMLLQQGYYFTKVTSHEHIIEASKIDYYFALMRTQATWKTDAEDITPWLIFFLNTIKSQGKQALKAIEGDNIDHLFSEKQLALWNWVNSNAPAEFSRRDAVNALGFTERTVESIIKKLVDLKRLNRLGQGQATRYKLVQ